MKDFISQHIANVAWAFATLGHKDKQLFTALAAAAGQRMKDFSSQELANTAWASAKVDQKDEQLFGALSAVPPFSVAWATFTPDPPRTEVLDDQDPPLLDIFSNHFF